MRTVKILSGNLMAVASLLLMASCNNEATDSVSKADSINRAERRAADSINQAKIPDENVSKFLVRASNSSMTEVMMSQIALDRGTNKAVKDISKTLIDDHKALHDQVKSLAMQRNITLPDSISTDSREEYDDLLKKRGGDFDKEYVSEMIDEHEDGIKSMEDIVNNTNDAGIRTFAENSLVKMRTHLQTLKNIKDGMK